MEVKNRVFLGEGAGGFCQENSLESFYSSGFMTHTSVGIKYDVSGVLELTNATDVIQMKMKVL